jgi:triacylglycerol esterase/lipase EstA (alpha/beta hydrolase family)
MSVRLLTSLLLLVQAACAAAIAAALMHWYAMPPLVAGLAGLLAVLLVRLGISFNNFMLSARYASDTPAAFRLSPLGWLRLVGEEFFATMSASSWSMVKGRAGQTIHAGSSAPPVLLIHGYSCNSGYWAQLIALLDKAAISHASLDLEPLMGSIDDYAPMVAQAADALCEAAAAQRCIIVAHSMGGLVARAYLRAYGPARIAHVFTLATPHHGTSLANFGPGENARQMRFDGGTDAWLHQLAAMETPATRALFTSMYTHHDNIVAPQSSSVLPGARNIAFGGVGHVAMGRNSQILSCLMHEMWALSPKK